MKRILSVTLLAVLAGVVTLPAGEQAKDKPAEEKNDRADQLNALKQDFEKLFPGVLKEYRAATDDAGRNKALARFDPIVDRAYMLVADNPKDDVAFDTLLFTMQARPQTPPKTIDLLAEHHLNNPRLGTVLQRLLNNPDLAGVKLMKAALAKSMDKNVQGLACFGLGKWVFSKSEDLYATNALESAKLSLDAEALLDRVVKEFAGVSAGREKLGAMAEQTLFELRNLAIGKKAPEVVSRDLDDKEVKLSGYKGKVVVLDIWATWCGPCRAMIPHEREMVERFKDKPFVLVSISGDAKKEALVEFLKKEKMPWTHWWEGQRGAGILKDWNVRFFPTIYVIDANGVIRYRNVRGQQLEDAVGKLVKEVEKK